MASGIYNYVPLWKEWYIEELIGKGSYGEVYKIYRDVNGTREYAAAKYISVPKVEDKKKYRQYTDEQKRTIFAERTEKFSVEIDSMLKLRESNNVVKYEAHIKTEKKNEIGWDIIIRMELLTSLEDHLERNSLSRKDVAKLGIDICSAIASCQANKIIHRDIKIENIFVDPMGNYKLGDFGVSKVGTGTATGTVTGTEDYMAPEISQDHKYNETVDIYALGIALYQLLNNRRKPYIDADSVPGQEAEEQAHLSRIKGETMPPPKYGAELSSIILKACAFNRHDRYATPQEMSDDLKKAMELLNDEEVLKPIDSRNYDVTDDETESDFDDDRGGTQSDFDKKKKEKGGTQSDFDIIHKPRKEKSKLPLYGGIAAACIALIVLVFAFIPKSIEIDSIEGLPEEIVQVVIGETYELQPELIPADATSKLTYTSDNENVATVSEEGIITAKDAGEVKITVQGDDNINFVYVNVVPQKIPVTSIVGLSSTAELTVGSSLTVNAKVQPDDATEQKITYSSSNSNIATIGSDGVITAVAAGQTQITASADGITKTMILTVKAKQQPVTTKPQTTKPKNNYTPPANNPPAVNNTPSNNSGGNNNVGGGSGKEISPGVDFKYY